MEQQEHPRTSNQSYVTLRKGKVCFSFPMPIVISSTCTGWTFSILSNPTQSKMSLMMSDGF